MSFQILRKQRIWPRPEASWPQVRYFYIVAVNTSCQHWIVQQIGGMDCLQRTLVVWKASTCSFVVEQGSLSYWEHDLMEELPENSGEQKEVEGEGWRAWWY